MSNDKPNWGPYASSPYPGQPQGGYQWPPYGGAYGWGAGPQAAGPQAAGAQPGAGGRIDALDVLEGVLKDGFSLTNLTRIARASGSNFWVGAAIGAGLVVLVNRPDVRDTISSFFSKATAPEPAAAPEAPAEPPKA